MALKAVNQVKHFSGSSDYELQTKSGESIRVKGIYIANATNDFATVKIDKTTVGYFRVGGARGNHLHYPLQDEQRDKNLLDLLRDREIFTDYPLAEGQKIILTGFQGANTEATIVYDVYDAGDVTPDNPNGTEANEYIFVNYGRPSSAPTGAGDVLIDSSVNPVEFPQFPFGKLVPAGYEIDLIGILASDVGKTTGTGANKANTTYVKFVRGRTVLWDDDRNGIKLKGVSPASDGTNIGTGYSQIGYYSDMDQRHPYFFPQVLTFAQGEELNIYITTEVTAGSQNLTAEDLEIALIMKVRRGG